METSRLVRRHPATIVFRIVFVVMIFSVLYSAFIFGTGYDEELNASVPFFSMFEVGLVLFVALTCVELFYAGVQLLQWSRDSFLLTPNDIVHRRGVWSVRRDQYTLRTIERVECKQPLLGRIFNYGTVTLHGRFLKEPVVLRCIDAPASCADYLRSHVMVFPLTDATLSASA